MYGTTGVTSVGAGAGGAAALAVTGYGAVLPTIVGLALIVFGLLMVRAAHARRAV
jgi:hypothetical protein